MRKLLIITSFILCLLMVNQASAYEQVLDNYALGADTSASDVGYGWVSSRAVDGNTGSGYHSTDNDAVDHWLEVDLGQPRDLQRIEIVNRGGFLDRLNGAIVVALDANRDTVFTSDAITGSPAVAQYDGDFAEVQYIRVEQSGPVLTVMELRALKVEQLYYLPANSNLTQFEAIATQTTPNGSYPATNAINGNTGDFTHTDATTPDNFWQVELADEFYIDKVVVYNRSSCCGERLVNAVLTISNEAGDVLFTDIFTDPNFVYTGSVHTFLLPTPTYAKFVKIGLENGQPNGQESNDNYVIALAEVMVIGGTFQSAWDPTPENGEIEVDVDQDLSWRPGEDPNGLIPSTTGYKLYFGTDASAVAQRDVSTAQGGLIDIGAETFDPGTLDKDTTYYWAVDQRLQADANTMPGLLWSFTTPLTLPVVDSQPTDALTIAGGYASFTVVATDPLGGELAYAWHKVGSASILSTTETLELIDVSADAAGEYVCMISNVYTIDSAAAELKIAKPVVEWKFNEASGAVATDSSGNGIDGTLGIGFTDDERIIDGGRTGVAGDNAIYFPGNADATVIAADVDLSALPVNDIFLGDSSWTINMWINRTDAISISMIGGFGRCDWADAGPQNERYFNVWNTDLEFQTGGNDGFWPGANIPAGEWTMFTVAYDSSTMNAVMYVDGVAIGTKSYPNLIDVTEKSFKLGDIGAVAHVASQGLTQVSLDALIDDFSVWDGALGPFEIGMLDKGYGCLEAIIGDVNGDCQVNIQDISIAMGSWLDCGLVPDCL